MPVSLRPSNFAKPLQAFVKLESFSSILLLFATALALFLANSSWLEHYFHILHYSLKANFGTFAIATSLQHGINDGLMTLFFFVVGLEIKREFLNGELATLKQASFPLMAALGGMLVPALIYAILNQGLDTAHGWGVPMATDIAFALGVLTLLGNRIPYSLKVFLMALAIIDDLGSILVIALFYSEGISWIGLSLAGIVFSALILLGKFHIRQPLYYLILGVLLWFFLIRAGIHGTIAGVLTALTMREPLFSLEKLVKQFHPWTSYLILPLFALANAGVPIHGDLFHSLGNPASLGIIFGLCLGKPLGIFLACWITLKLGFTAPSGGVQLRQIFGAGILGGIGFTMSIFVAGLAFGNPEVLNTAKLSIFLASLFSGLVGYLFLRYVR